jgi:twinkle protein
MSKLEKAVMAIDEIAKQRKFQSVPKVDFIKYMNERNAENDNVRTVKDFKDEVIERMSGTKSIGATMPWTKTHEHIKFRPSEVSMWTGFNGHKKSMVLGYISLDFLRQNEPVCIASFEMKPSSTIKRMLCQAAGSLQPTELALDKFIDYCDNKLWLYDKQGTITPEQLYGVIYYTAEKLGVKHFIIDSLMRVVAGEDDYNAQKNFVSKLCDIALETGIHIHFVHHNRKGDETKPAGRYGAKGSGSLSDNVHNAFEVHQRYRRDDEEENELPDMYVICDKQREGEWQGRIALWFDENSLQFMGSKDSKVRNWI